MLLTITIVNNAGAGRVVHKFENASLQSYVAPEACCESHVDEVHEYNKILRR